jgi:hypothetical protein
MEELRVLPQALQAVLMWRRWPKGPLVHSTCFPAAMKAGLVHIQLHQTGFHVPKCLGFIGEGQG